MKLISFNTNSIRMRLHQLEALIANHNPDVIGIQETKCQDADFPIAEIEAMGYQAIFHGQKTHYGVAMLSKMPAQNVQKGFIGEPEDAQRRFIAADFEIDGEMIRIANGYFPQGENRDHPTKFPMKEWYYENICAYVEGIDNDQFIVMGDMNIAPVDEDIGIGPANAKRWLREGKSSFLPEEREWFENMENTGLVDTFRYLHPEVDDVYSWFDYRSKGFQAEPKRGLRIDMIMASDALIEQLTDAGVDYEARGMEKPSDHAPIWAYFE